jgi:hypothetical protein
VPADGVSASLERHEAMGIAIGPQATSSPAHGHGGSLGIWSVPGETPAQAASKVDALPPLWTVAADHHHNFGGRVRPGDGDPLLAIGRRRWGCPREVERAKAPTLPAGWITTGRWLFWHQTARSSPGALRERVERLRPAVVSSIRGRVLGPSTGRASVSPSDGSGTVRIWSVEEHPRLLQTARAAAWRRF